MHTLGLTGMTKDRGPLGLILGTSRTHLARLLGLIAVAVALLVGLGPSLAQAQESLLMMMPQVEVQSETSVGQRAPVSDGTSTGGDGSGQALERLRISYQSDSATIPGDVVFSVCEQNSWSGDIRGGTFAGMAGSPIQAVRMHLVGEAANHYDMYYRAAVVGKGWCDGWAKNGEDAGAPGLLPLEAIQVQLVSKGDVPPEPSGSPTVAGVGIEFSGYVSGQDWDGPKDSDNGVGVGGSVLQSFRARLTGAENRLDGSIRYRVFAGDSWHEWEQDGQDAYPVDANTPIEAIQMSLTGTAAQAYDLYYRVNSERYGWMGLAKNGENAGTANVGSRAVAIQVWLRPKGTELVPNPPSDTDQVYDERAAELKFTVYRSDNGEQDYAKSGEGLGTAGVALHDVKILLTGEHAVPGSVAYRVFAGGAWKDWVRDGESACAVDANAPITAIQVKLEGEIEKYADVHYRVYSTRYKWMGLAKNGESAGTANIGGCAANAIQIWLVPKNSLAPDLWPATEEYRAFVDHFESGDAELDSIVTSIIDTMTGRGPDALRNAFNYVSAFPYISMNKYPSGDWSPSYAKQMYWNYGGNCYRYASLFREIARGLGYKARVVSGEVPTNFDAHAAHGWVEIEIDGTIYIFDPDLNHEYPGHNFYQRTYDKPPINYTVYYQGPW